VKIKGLIRKEFGRIKADKRSLILLFTIPLILIVIFGLTTGGTPTKFFNVAMITRDDRPCYGNFPSNSSQYDQDFIDVVENKSSSFGMEEYYNATTDEDYEFSLNKYREWIKEELIDAILVLPPNFSETVENSTNTHIIYFVDGSDSGAINAIEVSLQEPISIFRIQTGITENFTMFTPYLEYEVPFWESQVLNYALSLILPLIIIGTTMNLSCLSIVSEGPLPRMLITPTTKREIIISKFIANFVIMVFQAIEIFAVTALFGLYVLGSLFDFFITLILIGLSGISIGLMISSISKTEQQANQLYLMFFIMIMMFSGEFINVDGLPAVMQIFINILPLGHGVPLVVDVNLKGLPLDLGRVLGLLAISGGALILTYIFYSIKSIEV
jgi:ABC-2 type transport system permease protein